MKIVHATEIDIGGTATVLHLLLKNQVLDTRITSSSCLIPKTLQATLTEVPNHAFHPYTRTGRNLTSLYNFSVSFTKTIWQQKPDLVHLHSTFAGILGRLILLMMRPFRRPRVVYCPHGFSFLMEGSDFKRKLFTYLERLLSLCTDKIICVSEYEKNSAIKSGIDPRKIDVIHNGTPIIHASKTLTDSPYVTLEGKKNFLFAGRLDQAKGFDILLSAMRRVKDRNVHLTVAGISCNEVPDDARLKNITYLGWMSPAALQPYFIHSDALILPSRWEGFPMVVLEAMSLGIPVLASDCTSLPEAVVHGQTGLLFDISDINNISNILISTDSLTLNKMGEKGRDRFHKLFTSDVMTESTLSLYSILINGRKNRNFEGAV